MALDDIPRLGCGRSIDRIWATIDRPPTAHEEHCEQCQTARTRLQRLGEATRLLRESDLHDPALTPRPGIENAIMDVARAEVRRGSSILLRSADSGTTEISEQALSSLIRVAAAAIPGVHSRRCRIEIRSATASLAGEDHPSGTTDRRQCPSSPHRQSLGGRRPGHHHPSNNGGVATRDQQRASGRRRYWRRNRQHHR